MNSAKPKPFKSSLIPVTGKYSVQFTISGNSADCRWHPSQPPREEGMAISACGAYFEARNQAMAEFVAHTGQKVAVIGPGGVVVAFDGSVTA